MAKINNSIKKALKDYTSGKYDYYCDYSNILVHKKGKEQYNAIQELDKKNSHKSSDFIINAKNRVVELLNLINTQKLDDTVLYRLQKEPSNLKKGDIVKWGIRSTTRDEQLPYRIINGDEDGFYPIRKTPTIFKIVGDKKHLDIACYSEFNQSESLVYGCFEVLEVIEPSKTLSIKKQTFSEALADFKENFIFFKNKKGAEMVKVSDGRVFFSSSLEHKDFYNGTLDIKLKIKYEDEKKNLYKRPRYITIKQIINEQ